MGLTHGRWSRRLVVFYHLGSFFLKVLVQRLPLGDALLFLVVSAGETKRPRLAAHTLRIWALRFLISSLYFSDPIVSATRVAGACDFGQAYRQWPLRRHARARFEHCHGPP